MAYEKLPKLFYKEGELFYKAELDKRKNSYGSYMTPLMINGFRKGKKTNETFRLFYVNTHELMSLNNKVLINSSMISYLISKLPKLVIEPYFHKLIVNEAQSNNEIEGVKSTKRELKEALSEILKSEKAKKRFTGLMKTYLFIDQIDPFTEITEFRALYDTLVSDEIAEENIPDGKIFRKGYVEVNDGLKTTHIGIDSELKIAEALHALINFLDDKQHPDLYRYMAGHYFYEYIHPFYDGNGRTGRLLVCSYLSRYLDKYSAISFSYSVNKNKSTYYKALEEIPSPLNKGEMTFFLKDMLKLLAEGQEGIIEDLELNLSKMERIKGFFKKERWHKQREEAEVLQIMTYLNIFIPDETHISVSRLMGFTNQSRYKINQIMKNLEVGGYVELIRQRPKAYEVTDGFLESILEM